MYVIKDCDFFENIYYYQIRSLGENTSEDLSWLTCSKNEI